MNRVFTFQHNGLLLEVSYLDLNPTRVTRVIAFQIGQTIKQKVKLLTKLYNCSPNFKAMIDKEATAHSELCNEDGRDHYYTDDYEQ